MSHDIGFHFLDVYWEFNEKAHLFEDGLHLNSEGAGILLLVSNTCTFLDQDVPTLIVGKRGRRSTSNSTSMNKPSKCSLHQHQHYHLHHHHPQHLSHQHHNYQYANIHTHNQTHSVFSANVQSFPTKFD